MRPAPLAYSFPGGKESKDLSGLLIAGRVKAISIATDSPFSKPSRAKPSASVNNLYSLAVLRKSRTAAFEAPPLTVGL